MMDVIDWLMDGDPAIRWQVMADLTDADPASISAERARVEHEGWGARLLTLEDDNGLWAGGAYMPDDFRRDEGGQPWTATMHTLQTLKVLGLPRDSKSAQRAVTLIGENARWEHDGEPYFEGEVEPCINGRTVEAGAYFGVEVDSVVERLLSESLDDGGWNCDVEIGSTRTSFDTTINVLEGLAEYQRSNPDGHDVDDALRRGEEYLLERSLLRRKSTGDVVRDIYTLFAFPFYWHYDVLRAIDYFRSVDRVDERLSEAIDLIGSKRPADGRWILDRIHPGRVHFHMEIEGEPSRWNTLRALRVLKWWDEAG